MLDVFSMVSPEVIREKVNSLAEAVQLERWQKKSQVKHMQGHPLQKRMTVSMICLGLLALSLLASKLPRGAG
jgi:hypothetical protein